MQHNSYVGSILWAFEVIQESGLMDGMDIFTGRRLEQSKTPFTPPRSV
jgi:hypothetical protein